MPVTVSYLGVTQGDTWPATTISGSIDIGSADDTRQIVAVVSMQDDGCYATGGTFAGETATVDEVSSTTVGRQISILRASVPTGSGSQTLSVTVTPYTGNFVTHWFSVVGASDTLIDADSVVPAGGNSYTLTVDAVTDGAILAAGTYVNIEFTPNPEFDGFDFNQIHLQQSTYLNSGYVETTADAPFDILAVTPTPSGVVFFAAIAFGPASAGGSVEAVAASGSIGIVGSAITATATANVWATATSGSIGVTGSQASASATANVTATATSGSIEIVGSACSASATANVWAAAQSGSIRIVGSEITAQSGNNVVATATAGSIGISGSQPTASATGHRWAVADAGSIGIVGSQVSASVSGSVVATATSGSIRIVGSQCSAEAGSSATATATAGRISVVGAGITVSIGTPSPGNRIARAEAVNRSVETDDAGRNVSVSSASRIARAA